MPFVSEAQEEWAHTPEGTKALGGPEKVKEWESETDHSNLPKRKKPGPKPKKKPRYRQATRQTRY